MYLFFFVLYASVHKQYQIKEKQKAFESARRFEKGNSFPSIKNIKGPHCAEEQLRKKLQQDC